MHAAHEVQPGHKVEAEVSCSDFVGQAEARGLVGLTTLYCHMQHTLDNEKTYCSCNESYDSENSNI